MNDYGRPFDGRRVRCVRSNVNHIFHFPISIDRKMLFPCHQFSKIRGAGAVGCESRAHQANTKSEFTKLIESDNNNRAITCLAPTNLQRPTIVVNTHTRFPFNSIVSLCRVAGYLSDEHRIACSSTTSSTQHKGNCFPSKYCRRGER